MNLRLKYYILILLFPILVYSQTSFYTSNIIYGDYELNDKIENQSPLNFKNFDEYILTTIYRFGYSKFNEDFVYAGIKFPIKYEKLVYNNSSLNTYKGFFTGIKLYGGYVNNNIVMNPEIDAFYFFPLEVNTFKDYVSLGLGSSVSLYYFSPKLYVRTALVTFDLGYNIEFSEHKYTSFKGFKFGVGVDFF